MKCLKHRDFLIFLLLGTQQEKWEASGPALIHSELTQQGPQKPRAFHKELISPLSHNIQPSPCNVTKMQL